MLTPLDLNNKTFGKGFRGYNTGEVDDFFSQLAKDYTRLYQDNVELKNTVERVSAKLEYYKQMESTLQSTLNVAQETADEVKRGGEQRLRLMEQQTTIECNKKRAEADAYSARVRGDADAYVNKAHNEADAYAAQVRNETNTYCEKMKSDTTSLVERMKHIAEIEVAKLKVTSEDESNRLLGDAREQSHNMLAEATERSNKMIYDASEEARRRLFDAETKTSTVLNVYETQVKRLAMNRNTVVSFLEAQIENFKKFTGSADDVNSLEDELAQIMAARSKMEKASAEARSKLDDAADENLGIQSEAAERVCVPDAAEAPEDAAAPDFSDGQTDDTMAENVGIESAPADADADSSAEEEICEGEGKKFTDDTIRLPESAIMLAHARGEEQK